MTVETKTKTNVKQAVPFFRVSNIERSVRYGIAGKAAQRHPDLAILLHVAISASWMPRKMFSSVACGERSAGRSGNGILSMRYAVPASLIPGAAVVK